LLGLGYRCRSPRSHRRKGTGGIRGPGWARPQGSSNSSSMRWADRPAAGSTTWPVSWKRPGGDRRRRAGTAAGPSRSCGALRPGSSRDCGGGPYEPLRRPAGLWPGLEGLPAGHRGARDRPVLRPREPTRRFLVADETGLGKSVVARGVIAKTLERLQDDPSVKTRRRDLRLPPTRDVCPTEHRPTAGHLRRGPSTVSKPADSPGQARPGSQRGAGRHGQADQSGRVQPRERRSTRGVGVPGRPRSGRCCSCCWTKSWASKAGVGRAALPRACRAPSAPPERFRTAVPAVAGHPR